MDNQLHTTKDKITLAQPHTNWRLGLDYAERIGLGTQEYELITVE